MLQKYFLPTNNLCNVPKVAAVYVSHDKHPVASQELSSKHTHTKKYLR